MPKTHTRCFFHKLKYEFEPFKKQKMSQIHGMTISATPQKAKISWIYGMISVLVFNKRMVTPVMSLDGS